MAEVVVPVVVLVRQTICQAIIMSLEDTQIHSVCSLILFACSLPFFLLKKCWLSRTKSQTIPNPQLEGFPSSNCSSKSMTHLILAAARICKPWSKGVFASSFPIKPKPEELFNLKNAKKPVFRQGLRSSVSVPMDEARSATFEMIESWGLKALEHHRFIGFFLWRLWGWPRRSQVCKW